jgi:hypothetical protein
MTRRIAGGRSAVVCAALIALLVALVAAPAGQAKPRSIVKTVVKDCSKSSTGLLRHRYSARVLKLAKRAVKGDLAEYTGCLDAINAQLRRTRATVVARVVRRAGGPAVAGRVTLLYKRRVVDELAVKRGKSVTFKVQPGRYVVRADGKRRCTATVTAKPRKKVRAAVVCR